MIDKSMRQLDQLLQDVQEPKPERDQRDEFQVKDDHVALAILDSKSYIEVCGVITSNSVISIHHM